LLSAAPHLIRGLEFVLPHEHAVRPWWMVRVGLYLYDLLGGKSSLPHSRSLTPRDRAFTDPLKGGAKGFVYWDAFVDDARLTLANALDAAANGASIDTYCALESAERIDSGWRATLAGGRTVTVRGLVNAAGPWGHEMLGKLGVASASNVRLVKGSHIVVPRLYEGDHAYILQQPDRRIVFAIPYQHDFTAIGTTDIPVDAPEDAVISEEEIAYLCDAANRHFVRQIARTDVASSWSGVRPLYDDGAANASSVTRDYVLELDVGGAPLLSVFGGKITTARQLAEDALARLGPALGIAPHPVTPARVFPGGAIADFDTFLARVRATWPFLGAERSERMARAYGAALGEMLEGVGDEAAMGRLFGAGLSEVELAWMRTREWARTAADALDRRSKLGLHMSDSERAAVGEWFAVQAVSRAC
jgi:glycerol-3-phosphate dehydrogenase